NAPGDVVGAYTDSIGRTHGFLRSGAMFTAIDYPLANRTRAIGINSAGWISGNFDDSTGHTHGFVYRRGNFAIVDYPGAQQTVGGGLNDSGQLVGMYRNKISDPGSGFLATPCPDP